MDTVQPLCRQSLKPHVSFVLEKTGTGSPKGSAGGLQVTQRCDNLIGDSGGQTLLVTLGLMTCEVTGPI